MKAFTVYQPYAYAIVAGIKPHETRPRRTNIRGRVAVHAGKRGFYAGGPLAVKQKTDAIRVISETEYEQKGERPIEELPYFPKGVVIGTIEIVDCVPVEEVLPTLTERERLLGDYSPGRFAWVLKDPIMFDKPIPATGKQGWWNWDENSQGTEG
jgi:hypothetical protein